MAEIIIMPKQGLQMTQGTIVRWLVKEGDLIEKGEPIVEVETDKLTIAIDSTASGSVLQLLHDEGDEVPITEPIAIIGTPDEDISSIEVSTPSEAKDNDHEEEQDKKQDIDVVMEIDISPEDRVFATPRAKMRADEKELDYRQVRGTGPQGLIIENDILNSASQNTVFASPLAKKVAVLDGVELKGIKGTGSHGKIVVADVTKASTNTEIETSIPLTGMRKIIAKQMHASLNTQAQANHRITVDMTEAIKIREQFKSQGIKVSYNDIIIKCVAKALTNHPMMNASMTEDAIILKNYVNMGMAVAVDNGLLVPVIKNADKLSLRDISDVSTKLATKAKDGTLMPDEMSGGTFTISNLGMFDIDSFTAIVNAPESGILAVGKMEKKPVVIDDEIVIRPLMMISLTYDHRVIDGAPAAQFLKEVKTLLQMPALLI